MDYLETEGDTIDEAIEKALRSLGVNRDKVTVDILAEARKGILGFGAQKARIRASLRKSIIDLKLPVDLRTAPSAPPSAETPVTQAEATAIGEHAKDVLAQILRLMEIEASISLKVEANGEEIVLDIHTENSGLLIGRKGQTLEALQYMVTRIVTDKQSTEGPHISIDTENYQERRRKSLEDMALRLGEKAKRRRKSVTVDALNAADRRIVHAALQDDPWLTTRSLGQGAYRRLLIIPEGDRKNKEEGKSPVSEKAGTKSSK